MKYNIITWLLLVGLVLVSGVNAGGCLGFNKVKALHSLQVRSK
jgi:hypothetical protein